MQRGIQAHLAAGGDNVALATPQIFPLLPLQQHEGRPEGHHPCKPCPQPAGIGVHHELAVLVGSRGTCPSWQTCHTSASHAQTGSSFSMMTLRSSTDEDAAHRPDGDVGHRAIWQAANELCCLRKQLAGFIWWDGSGCCCCC